MQSKIDSLYVKHNNTRIVQGDILRDFIYYQWTQQEDNDAIFDKITIPYVVILTQDCDLQWDFENRTIKKENQDKFIQSILICPAYPSESIKSGEHLKSINLQMQKLNSIWSRITTNEHPRYHYLPANPEFQIPELIIDFKHYYAIPRDVLYVLFKKHYIGTINEIFREQLSQRFAYYLSRIGLPELKK